MSRRKRAARSSAEALILLRAIEPLLCATGQREPPYDPWRIASLLGVPVHDDITPGIDGYLRVADHETTIVLNRKASWVRRRFTLAHELGHLLILKAAQERGGTLPTLVRYRVGLSDKAKAISDPGEERLCNMFAASLLMPTKDIRTFWKAYPWTPHSLEHCSRYFDVSLPAAAIRASKLFRHQLHISYWEARPWVHRKWKTGKKLSVDLDRTLERHVERVFHNRFSPGNRSLPRSVNMGGLTATLQQCGTRSMLVTVQKVGWSALIDEEVEVPLPKDGPASQVNQWLCSTTAELSQQRLPGMG